MLNKYKNFLFFFCLFILILVYTIGIIPINIDEIWEYGYGYNISIGMVPYRDFNMVVTPLYPFCISLFIKIFGPYLLSVNIFNALILTGVFYLFYRMIGYKMIILLPLVLMLSYPTYNNLLLFLFLLLIYIKKSNINSNMKTIVSALIISFIFLTKQSVGGVLFVLDFFISDNKKKYICAFLIPIFILIIYLIINNSLYQFIDYSFLGLFDFGTRNGNFSVIMLSSISVCILLFLLYKMYKKEELLYCVFYQVIAFPIFDFFHLVLGLIIFVFAFLFVYSDKLSKLYVIVITIIFSLFLYIYNVNIIFNQDMFVIKNDNYLYGKKVQSSYVYTISETSGVINKYENNYDRIYNLTRYSYLTKLYNGTTIDKFDMVLDGNMGYKGYLKYIEEMDNNCKNKKCLFIIQPEIENNYKQKNYEIIDYVVNKYTLLESKLDLEYEIYGN